MRVRLFSPITSALAAVALAATMLATAAPSATADPSPPADQAVSTGSAATAANGWFLGVVSRGRRTLYGIDAATQTLELISPTGQRRVLFASTIAKRGNGTLALADWSADGRTALLSYTVGTWRTRALAVDVPTGAVRAVDVPKEAFLSLLAPDGSGVVVTSYSTEGSTVSRLGWDGTMTALGYSFGPLIATGPTTVLGQTMGNRKTSVDVFSTATGGLVARFETPGFRCDPVRRWDTVRIELTCSATANTGATGLLLLDTSTGALSLPTLSHPMSKRFYGDLDARVLDSGTYVQAYTDCAMQVARQGSDGRLTQVTPTTSRKSVTLVTATASELVIQRGTTCVDRTTRSTLSRLDPVSGVETPIVALPGRESFDRVLAFGEARASAY